EKGIAFPTGLAFFFANGGSLRNSGNRSTLVVASPGRCPPQWRTRRRARQPAGLLPVDERAHCVALERSRGLAAFAPNRGHRGIGNRSHHHPSAPGKLSRPRTG